MGLANQLSNFKGSKPTSSKYILFVLLLDKYVHVVEIITV